MQAAARARRKAAAVKRNHGHDYTTRRTITGAASFGSSVLHGFAGKISKTAKKSGGGR